MPQSPLLMSCQDCCFWIYGTLSPSLSFLKLPQKAPSISSSPSRWEPKNYWINKMCCIVTRIAFKKDTNRSLAYDLSSLSFFLYILLTTPSLEHYEQAYMVHTGFAEWKPTSYHVKYWRFFLTCTGGNYSCAGGLQLTSRSEGSLRIMSRSTLYTLVLQNESYCRFFDLHMGDCPCTGGLQLTSHQKNVHLSSVISVNGAKESVFGHQNFFLPAVGIKPMTSSTKGQCASH